MLYALSVVICLAGNPSVCETHPVQDPQAEITISSCAVIGAQQGAALVKDRPKWKVERVNCTPGGRFKGKKIGI